MDASQKPDLMALSAGPVGANRRILAQLEHGARLPSVKPARPTGWTIDGWTVGLGLLLAMCAMAWLIHEDTITPNAYQAHHAYQPHQGGSRSNVGTRPGPAAADTDAATTAAIATQAEQAAAIVNDTTIARAAPAAGPEARTGNDTQASGSAGTAALAASTDAAAPSVTKRPTTNTTRKTVSTATSSGASKASSNAAKNVANNAAAMPTARTKPAAKGDSDVILLTALVAHANHATQANQAGTAIERSRDVVERRDGDQTADLLARCRKLGTMEGLLCRSRICTGRWEAERACRAPAH